MIPAQTADKQSPLSMDSSDAGSSDSGIYQGSSSAIAGEEAPRPSSSGDSQRKKLASAIFLVGQPLLLNAISIPATAYIIRSLGAHQYGEWATAAAVVFAVATFASLGLRSIFVRSVAQKPEEAEAALGEQLGLRGLLSIGSALLALLAAVLLGYNNLVVTCVGIAALSLVFTTISSAFSDALQGFQRFQVFATVNLIAGLLLTVASVLMVYLGYGPVGLAMAYMIGPLFSLVIFYLCVRRDYFRPSPCWNLTRYRVLLKEARMVGAQGILSTVQSRFEQLIIPKLVGYTGMGYFSAGLMIADRLVMVPDGIATAYFPIISKSAHEDMKEANRHVVFFTTISLMLAVPLVLLTMVIAHPLSVFFFKKDPLVCTQVIWITIWSLPFMALYSPIYTSLQAYGSYSEASARVMKSMILSTIFSLLLIWQFGLIGACWSWVMRHGMTVLFLLPGFIRVFPSVFPRIPLGRILVCGGVMGGILWVFQTLEASLLVTLGLGSLLALLAYFGSLVLLNVIQASQIRQLLQRR